MPNTVAKVQRADAVEGPAQIISIIQEIAARPEIDIERMMQMLKFHDQIVERQARKEFAAASAAMQPELPVTERRGKIEYEGKKGRATPYALWEDINEDIKPVLAKHGFALSFRIGDDLEHHLVHVTAILDHIGGHSVATSKALPYDTTGAKNAVQSQGSSISYGKRQTAGALLNLTSRGEDDDGKGGGEVKEKVSDDQIKAIEDKIVASGIDRKNILVYFKIAEISDLPADLYEHAMKKLDKTISAKKGKS